MVLLYRINHARALGYAPLLTGALAVGAISTITDDTKYNAWPNVLRMGNGNLICVYTKGDSHHNDNTGNAVCKISSDEGATWGSETTVYDHATLWTTAMGIGLSSSGRLFVTLFRDNYSVDGTGEAGIVYSDDNGATWSSWVALTSSFTQEAYGAGPVTEVPGGDLLVTIEGSNTGTAIANRSSHTLRSSDDGATWGSEVTVRNYATDSRPYYESKLVVLDNGKLLCVHRTSSLSGTHYMSTSTDNGLTWGAPTSAFTGCGAPATIQVSGGGVLICVTRRNTDFKCAAYTSIDKGTTWSASIELDATMNEMEYGCPVRLNDGRILVVYGYQPTSAITNADIKQVYLTLS